MQNYIRRAAAMSIRQVPREELGPLPTFTIPTRARNGPPTVEITVTEHKNTYAPLAPLGNGTKDRESESPSFSSVSGASVGSRSRGSMGRDPIPLTPEILHLIDRLEPDKGKHDRMLTNHLTRPRLLLATEHKLHAQLEKRAQKDLRKQQVVAEATANRAAELADMGKALHTDVMLQQITDTTRSEALAAGAIEEEAHATGATTTAIARAEKNHAPM
jgi:hypothetical protein